MSGLPLHGASFLVLGLGATGLALVRYLLARGATVAVADSRAEPPELGTLRSAFPKISVHLGPFEALSFSRDQTVVVSPGLAPESLPLDAIKAAGCPVRGELDLFFEEAKAPVLGITGTNGKSTVTVLLGHLLAAAGYRVAVGGNLGPAAISLLDGPAPEVFVLELSSFQLDWSELLPLRQALYLNLSSDHLDRYDDLAAYGAAKGRIYPRARRCLYNAGDEATTPSPEALDRAIPIGLRVPAAPFGVVDGVLRGPEGWSWPLDRLPLVGAHNLENVLFALTAAWDFGANLEALGPALENFTPLPHRCAVAGWVQGVRYVNDSKATNVGATVAALRGLGPLDKVVLLAGGLAKGADLSPLRPAVTGLRHAFLFGADARPLAAALGDACPVTCVETLDAGLSAAVDLASPGDTVILAPACASFDQFRSFEHRGEVFEAAVAELADRRGAYA